MSSRTPTSSSRPTHAGRELALTIGAVAGLICVLAAAASMLFGIKPLVFRSGSMSPEITTGSLALARTVPATDLVVGDVVSVVNSQGTRITHRVYDFESQAGNSVAVTLKGDANTQPDTEPYLITEADRIFFSVGGLGYAVEWLSSPLAIFLGGAMVGGLVMVAFRPASRSDDSDGSSGGGIGSSAADSVDTTEIPIVSAHSDRGGLRGPLSLRKLTILGVAGLSVFGATQVSGTAAAFTDTSIAKSSFTTAANYPVAPSPITCQHFVSVNNARVKWTHIGPGYYYQVRYMWTGQTAPMQTWTIDPGQAALAGIQLNQDITSSDAGYSVLYSYTYTVRVVTIERATGRESATWNGYDVHQGASSFYVSCVDASNGLNSSAVAAKARGLAPDPTTTAATTTETATTTADATPTTDAAMSTGTSTSSAAESFTPATTETSNATTVESSTETTTAATTTVTTTPEVTTTTTQAPVVLDGPETSPTGYAATVVQSDAGAAVVVTNSSGATLSSTPVSATAKIKWQFDSDTLWIVDGTDVYLVSASTGVSEKNPSAAPPADIAAWIDGLK